VQGLSGGRGKIPKPKTDASQTHSSDIFPSPVSLGTEICFGLRLAYPAGAMHEIKVRFTVEAIGNHRYPP
jgi:hypothetical protein